MNLFTIPEQQRTAVPADSILRKTTQFLMPEKLQEPEHAPDAYQIYPACALGAGYIHHGFNSLSAWIAEHKTVIIDGYIGIFWDKIQAALQQHLQETDMQVHWIVTTDFLKPAAVIDSMLEPFLGTYESVWGTRCTLSLQDFYDLPALQNQHPDSATDINIIIGPGAALAGWQAPVIYIDLPKNELQFRMRAGAITNLGSERVFDPFYMYKRFYFVDWVLLNQHKKALLQRIDVIADGQQLNEINWMTGQTLQNGLGRLSSSVIRVRPWFEPGAWGGEWIKSNIKGVNTDVVNYAWSFELIVPENGLVFESDGWLLEVSFDFLMFQHSKQVLGDYAAIYEDEFPIRFDFLDTVKGGNLSIQCHPRLNYIQENFGERITQDETYYILDCEPEAKVYLGFQESIHPEEFRAALETSQMESQPIQIEKYVQVHPAQKHDLFLIPNGTVHSAGAGNLVLEISATPYIFTFKMYDWLRLDLDGKPRPINIEHAFQNLDFSRNGDKVSQELISRPVELRRTEDAVIVHLPTHPDHFYDVHRLEFDREIEVQLHGGCHVMMLVEGQSVLLETAAGVQHLFAYAETFVIPAAAKSYRLINQGETRAKVIKAFLK
jgi:mannose-6-phosphate isomerase class I